MLESFNVMWCSILITYWPIFKLILKDLGVSTLRWLEHCSANLSLAGSNPTYSCVCGISSHWQMLLGDISQVWRASRLHYLTQYHSTHERLQCSGHKCNQTLHLTFPPTACQQINCDGIFQSFRHYGLNVST